MTGDPILSRIKLGMSPSVGKQAVDQAVQAKQLLLKRFGRADSAWLETVHDDSGRRGLDVVFEEGNGEARAWAEKVRDAASKVWGQVKRAGKSRA